MRLKDADTIIEKIECLFKDLKSTEDFMGIGYNHGVGDSIATIKKLPTIEAEPVKHGKWDMSSGVAVCKACGKAPREFYIANSEHWHYCPNCGAKMEGAEE